MFNRKERVLSFTKHTVFARRWGSAWLNSVCASHIWKSSHIYATLSDLQVYIDNVKWRQIFLRWPSATLLVFLPFLGRHFWRLAVAGLLGGWSAAAGLLFLAGSSLMHTRAPVGSCSVGSSSTSSGMPRHLPGFASSHHLPSRHRLPHRQMPCPHSTLSSPLRHLPSSARLLGLLWATAATRGLPRRHLPTIKGWVYILPTHQRFLDHWVDGELGLPGWHQHPSV